MSAIDPYGGVGRDNAGRAGGNVLRRPFRCFLRDYFTYLVVTTSPLGAGAQVEPVPLSTVWTWK